MDEGQRLPRIHQDGKGKVMLPFYEYAHLSMLTEELKKFLPQGSFSSRLWRTIGAEFHYRLVDWPDERETQYSSLFPIEALFVWATQEDGLDPEWLASAEGIYLDDNGEVIPSNVKPVLPPLEQLAAYGLWLLEVKMEALGPVPDAEPDENEVFSDKQSKEDRQLPKEESTECDWMPEEGLTDGKWIPKQGENKQGWKRNQVIEHRATCLLNAYQALLYSQRIFKKEQPTPEENARAKNVDFAAMGKAGAQKRHAPMAELREWAIKKYKAGEWPSANQAAHKLKAEIIAFGRTIGARLSEENAQRTIAQWFRNPSSR